MTHLLMVLALGLFLVTGPLISNIVLIKASTEDEGGGGGDDGGSEGNGGDSGDGAEEGDGETDGGNTGDEPGEPSETESPPPSEGPEPTGPDPDAGDGDQNNVEEPLPYCDTPEGKASQSCHDRYDYDEDTLLYPCNDGSQATDPSKCPDATEPNPNPNPTLPPPQDITIIFKTIIKNIIKNEETIKKIYNDDLNLKETVIAINYDEGAGMNCVVNEQEQGQCETFIVTKDPGREPLLQVIPFSSLVKMN